MCTGGRLLADFQAGTDEQPDVPELVGACLTFTADGSWVVWARKVARAVTADGFLPLTPGGAYPADAVAQCRFAFGHDAPNLDCRCGFHAVSTESSLVAGRPVFPGGVRLDVALSGHILAYEWPEDGVLFRAARQTVLRVHGDHRVGRTVPPDDPDGLFACRSVGQPRGVGPIHLRLPQTPPEVAVADDAGYCMLEGRAGAKTAGGLLAPV
jgi:hypothetical protein